jgi:hypothetical protein
MDQHLSALLEYVREFAEPQGPDPLWWDERDRREAEWVRSRTTDDLLTLVGWIKEPTLPADRAVPTWTVGYRAWSPMPRTWLRLRDAAIATRDYTWR